MYTKIYYIFVFLIFVFLICIFKIKKLAGEYEPASIKIFDISIYKFNILGYNIYMVLQQLDIFGNAKNIPINKKKVKSSKARDDIILSQKLQKLNNIYNKIYNSLGISLFEKSEILYYSKTIVAYPIERQAEVISTQLLDIDERIRINEDWLNGRK